MDPYLEAPTVWPDVHSSLVPIFREQLSPSLAPKYVAELDTQVVIEKAWDEPQVVKPDVAVTTPVYIPAGETAVATPTPPVRSRVPMPIPTKLVTLYIRQRESDKVVTAIELLSPVNKRPGSGRDEYLEKRATYFSAPIHLVEIDLLRAWPRMPMDTPLPACDYLAIIAQFHERPNCDVWPIYLRQPLPVLPIPLLPPDPAVPLDMGQALRTAYTRARYDLRIDYRKPPAPPLAPQDAEWAASLLAKAL